MRRPLSALLTLLLVPPAAAAEVGVRTDVPMDRVPWELAEPRLEATVWWDKPHIPLDHPYWWTLTDSITPVELKGRIDSMMAEGAAEAGRRRTAADSSTGQPTAVTVTLSGQQSPELFPMWFVFISYALNRVRGEPAEQTIAELIDFGFEPITAALILEVSEEEFEKAAAESSQVIDDALQLIELYSRAREKVGTERLRKMQNTNDFALLSELVGWSEEALQELALNAKRKPEAEAAVAAIAKLRRRLAPADWNRLRRFLLVRIAPGITLGAGF